MFQFTRRIAKDIVQGKHLEYYVTLLFIILIFALDTFNLVSSESITNIILAILALVVYSNLTTHQRLEELSDKIIMPQGAERFFWKEKRSIEHDLSNAKYVGILGAVLSRTMRDYSSVLEERLKAGAKVRILLMDPESAAPDQAVLRSKDVNSRQFYVENLCMTIERVGFLVKTASTVELGLLPYKPAFGMIVIDPDEPYGKIIVEMYPHHSDAFAPTFELDAIRDRHWYTYFRAQFDAVWERTRQYNGATVQMLATTIRDRQQKASTGT